MSDHKLLSCYAPLQSLSIPPLNSKLVPFYTNCRAKRAIAPPPTLEIAALTLEVALLILEIAALTLTIPLLNSKLPP
ncbi:MAG: hypothetical protein V7K64_16495 [Nostoc sp.]|uniref:hypothetical protein n=1 Tax=unclassified Nostoc TaxID=2593658 RepID=UPI001E10C614|nr:hypothetical protein [Nostoc sp. JL34]MBN3883819.1 hypothetical protein [Nostoc sp. JL34]